MVLVITKVLSTRSVRILCIVLPTILPTQMPPLSRNDLSRKVQNAVLASISDPSFSVDMPKLSPEVWDQVCITDNKDENERLEFLGDSLMYTCIGIELYERIPDGTPHMYTVSEIMEHSFYTSV